MWILRSIAKSIKLRKISKVLGSTEQDMIFQNRKKEDALDNLFKICEADGALVEMLHRYGVCRNNLRELYYQLLANGAGQWVAGHYVAASTFAFVPTLSYILEAVRSGESLNEISFQLVEYFRNGDTILKRR